MDRLKHLCTVHVGSGEDGYSVNLSAYEKYVDEHYPNLHRPEFSNLKHVKKDNVLHNPVDIAMYKGLNAPDNIWDSMARSLYGMGYLGMYAKTATMLESGKNYLFDFTEFAHVYPCLRSMHGNAAKLQNLTYKASGDDTVDEDEPNLSEKLMKEFYHQLHKSRGTYPKCNNKIKSKEIDVELERRSPFNESFLNNDSKKNPKGSRWTYLTADRKEIELENFSDFKYGGEPTPLNTFDNKKYIYEKFVFCTTKSCPGAMRIILDCIHKVVIVSMVNSHFDCWETHKRRIFDVVRKLVVLHGADLEYIDTKYLSIPRRFGLTYVESWVNSDEYTRYKKSEYTPSYLCYSHKDEAGNWSQKKNRNWLSELFNENTESKATKREREDDEKNSLRVKSDLEKYGVKSWKSSPFRKDEIGNVIVRSEYEFHIEQFVNEKMREIYRVWRVMYFETTDKIKTLAKIYFGSMMALSQLYLILSGDTKNISFSAPLPPKYWESMMVQLARRYTRSGYIYLGSMLHLYKQPIFDPAILIPSFPANQKVGKLVDSPIDTMVDNNNYIIINATIEELANADDLYIVQRYMNFNYADVRRSGINENRWKGRDWSHYIGNMIREKLRKDELFRSNRILDDFYRPLSRDEVDFSIDETERKFRYFKAFHHKYKTSGVEGNIILKTNVYYKLSHVKFICGKKVHDAFIIHPKLLHETTFIDDLMKMRKVNKVSKLTIIEFPMYDSKEMEKYSSLFSSEKRKNTDGLNEKIDEASSKFEIEVAIVRTTEAIPVEIINTVYGMCVTKNQPKSIVDSMMQTLDYKLPPKRYTDLQRFYFHIDNTLIGTTAAFTRVKLNKLKKLIESVLIKENKEPSCTLNDDNSEFILKDDFIKHDIGHYVIYRSGRNYEKNDCLRIWKFVSLFHRDYTIGEFDSLFIELSLTSQRPNDMINTIECIKRRMQNTY
ncbi:hypothetical protein CANINC_002860 [Pichia inconspicua]|uniref:Uncharacterized protein n=1 Tax=Pichia inconspicua TaxID=52247 RepID=A0A4V4NFL8_9ASCO|nr:hypothetical protein CANINC_002860 [[Candida] inconspicua]